MGPQLAREYDQVLKVEIWALAFVVFEAATCVYTDP